jgi:hypothetical protein
MTQRSLSQLDDPRRLENELQYSAARYISKMGERVGLETDLHRHEMYAWLEDSPLSTEIGNIKRWNGRLSSADLALSSVERRHQMGRELNTRWTR